jgi:hypothetical protein
MPLSAENQGRTPHLVPAAIAIVAEWLVGEIPSTLPSCNANHPLALARLNYMASLFAMTRPGYSRY